MDFKLDETQTDLRKLAVEVLAKEAAQARIEEHEERGEPYDRRVWAAMGRAGLIGACLPEEAGGAGLGPVAMAVLLREVGAHVAPVPALHSLIAAQAVTRYGTREQRAALAPLAQGEAALTVALREPGADLVAGLQTVARRDGGSWLIDGRKTMVSYAAQAERILVPARTPDGPALFLVAQGAAAVREEPGAGREPVGTVVLDGTRGEWAGGADAVAGLRGLALAGITATASGVLAGALELTTGYIRTRRQFDRALAEFQAVTMQIADVYIAGRALDVAMWSGVWRLAAGLPAEEDLAIAALQVAESALTALHTCQHLHGGLGLDVTYPLHRYFAWGKHLAHLLGGAQAQLDLIGAHV
ncbi:acyl-CoA dehydrogenase family protein [Streptosporangium sp. KLBMP 9127]|nr:acyl-CoA/acyl-ACP dehydrogenase [Streptosporangium sp. KLBMP 9127]